MRRFILPIIAFCGIAVLSLIATAKPQHLNGGTQNLTVDRVFIIPIGERSPTPFGVFSEQGEFLYALPSGSRPYNARSVAPLNPAVLNRLILTPDSLIVWATSAGLEPVAGIDGRQIMRVARCVDSRNSLANSLYWNPNDAFCVCYRMQNDIKQKFYLSPAGKLIYPGPLSPHSGPMQEGLALVKVYDPEFDQNSMSPDSRPWQLLKADGSLTEIVSSISQPYSPFHLGRALVLLGGPQERGIGIINATGEVVAQPEVSLFEELQLRSRVVTTAHGYFILSKSTHSEDNNFLVLDLDGNEVIRFEGYSDLQVLGADRFLVRTKGAGRNQPATVQLQNKAGEVLQSWDHVIKIMPASGLDNSRLLAIGISPNNQIFHIDPDGNRLHRMMGIEAYQLGVDHYFIMQQEYRERWMTWKARRGNVRFDSRWFNGLQSWPLTEGIPLWSVSKLSVNADVSDFLTQSAQMAGLDELQLPSVDPALDFDQIRGNLGSLRKLTIDRISTEQLSSLLAKTPALTELSISYLTDTEGDFALPSPDRLGRIRVIVKGAAPIYQWLRSLPSLHHLKVFSDDAVFLQEVESWRDAHRWNIQTGQVGFSEGAIMEEEPVMQEAAPDRG